MNWWHEWRASYWQREHLICLGRIAQMNRSMTIDQYEWEMVNALKVVSEGKTMYHRLKAGMPL